MKTVYHNPASQAQAGSNRLRIIGGKWKRRILHFRGSSRLRPTPDAVRETLFNWLQTDIEGAKCLDLFAGSGALGFEAASRGAAEVVMVEKHRPTIQALTQNREKLAAENIQIIQADVSQFLHDRGGIFSPGFDIVFIDPPYWQNLITPVTQALLQGWLQVGALVYVEAEAALSPLPIPADWAIFRSQRKGEVGYHLCRTATPTPSS